MKMPKTRRRRRCSKITTVLEKMKHPSVEKKVIRKKQTKTSVVKLEVNTSTKITKQELQTAIDCLRKGKQETPKGSEPKTSKDATKRRKK